jgi:hypothetical protein
VPAVAGGDEHRVDVLAAQQLAEVPVTAAVGVAVVPVDEPLAGLAPPGLHVGDGDAAHVGEAQHGLEVAGAARADADHPERDLPAGGGLVAAGGAPRQGGRPGKGGRRRRPAAQECTTGCAWRSHGAALLTGAGRRRERKAHPHTPPASIYWFSSSCGTRPSNDLAHLGPLPPPRGRDVPCSKASTLTASSGATVSLRAMTVISVRRGQCTGAYRNSMHEFRA